MSARRWVRGVGLVGMMAVVVGLGRLAADPPTAPKSRTAAPAPKKAVPSPRPPVIIESGDVPPPPPPGGVSVPPRPLTPEEAAALGVDMKEAAGPAAGFVLAVMPDDLLFSFVAGASGVDVQSRPLVLDLETVYTLALIRDQRGPKEPRPPLASLRDPKFLAAQWAQRGGDFARFRGDWLATDAEGHWRFQDPATAFLDLNRRLLDYLHRRRLHAALEQYVKFFEAAPEDATFGAATRDELFNPLQEVRLADQELRDQFRAALDRFKVELGLPPSVAAIPDPRMIGPFMMVWTRYDEWTSRPDRRFEELTGILDTLPMLDDVVIEGKPVVGTKDEGEDQPEAVLATAARVAIGNRPELKAQTPRARERAEDELTLRVRDLVRDLRRLHQAYGIEKIGLVSLLRRKDAIQERLIAPPKMGPDRTVKVTAGDLLAIEQEITGSKDRLAGTWFAYQTRRLELVRTLKMSPGDSWDAFFRSLTPRPPSNKPTNRQDAKDAKSGRVNRP